MLPDKIYLWCLTTSHEEFLGLDEFHDWVSKNKPQTLFQFVLNSHLNVIYRVKDNGRVYIYYLEGGSSLYE